MKNTVEIFGMNETATYNTEDIKAYGEYEETVITEDGRLIGYDEAICQWVQLFGTEPSDY